jgi:hypothetical protein
MNEGKKSPTHPFFILIGCIMLILSVAKQTLAQDVKYNDQGPAHYPFIWSSPDSPYLTELRARYRLAEKVAGCENDYEKAKVIVSWVNSLWAHHGINTPQKSDPISILEEVEAGKRFRCVEYAIVVAGALNALGIPSRTLGLKTKDVESALIGAGHVVAEAYLQDQGKWIMIDGQWGVIPTLNGTPLNAVELQQALADRVMGLDVYSDSGVEKEQYFHWIKDYLYYLDVPFDNRTGIALEDYAGGILMLVREKAIRPEKFQVLWKIGNAIYTHSVQDFSWTKTLGHNNGKLVSNLSGGLSSEETPLNYQFKGGGKRGITLRGHQDNLAGNWYLSGNTEFHKLFFDLWGSGLLELWGIAFLDYAQIVPVCSGFGDVPWEIDGGVGVACAVPFGLLKFEVSWDNFKEKPNYYITFQEIF